MDVVSDKLDVFQFGAIKHNLTTHALIKIIHEWAQHTDDAKLGNLVRILFLDYSKAFDRVNPNLLISKLKQMDVPNLIIKCICAFLQGPEQKVKVQNSESVWLDIWGNVPQGTILGILLFKL